VAVSPGLARDRITIVYQLVATRTVGKLLDPRVTLADGSEEAARVLVRLPLKVAIFALAVVIYAGDLQFNLFRRERLRVSH
jgi:hypothetical protein